MDRLDNIAGGEDTDEEAQDAVLHAEQAAEATDGCEDIAKNAKKKDRTDKDCHEVHGSPLSTINHVGDEDGDEDEADDVHVMFLRVL